MMPMPGAGGQASKGGGAGAMHPSDFPAFGQTGTGAPGGSNQKMVYQAKKPKSGEESTAANSGNTTVDAANLMNARSGTGGNQQPGSEEMKAGG